MPQARCRVLRQLSLRGVRSGGVLCRLHSYGGRDTNGGVIISVSVSESTTAENHQLLVVVGGHFGFEEGDPGFAIVTASDLGALGESVIPPMQAPRATTTVTLSQS
jgi:hypothetical protein